MREPRGNNPPGNEIVMWLENAFAMATHLFRRNNRSLDTACDHFTTAQTETPNRRAKEQQIQTRLARQEQYARRRANPRVPGGDDISFSSIFLAVPSLGTIINIPAD